MTACVRRGCAGTIDETGFCDMCGRRPEEVPAGQGSATSSTSTRRLQGSAAVTFPIFDFPDPASRILHDPQVPDRVRRCANPDCTKPTALPKQSSGYCTNCGTSFSFLPALESGVVIGDQYEVIGCFDRGGLGWIYLAKDTRLDDNDVVLKGLIDVGDADLARAERQALTRIDHPNIVRIFNYVIHPDRTGAPRAYIVMEYVDGLVLSAVLEQSRHGELPLGEPLRIEHVILCGLQVLAAFDYLHGRGFLYCDLKPDNVIVRSGRHGDLDNRIKLIDLGAVRRIGDRDSKMVITREFQVAEAEIAAHGLTVGSDLYTVGETLYRLYLGTADRTGQHTTPKEQHRIRVGIDSFCQICDRARHRDPDRRFASAADLAGQLRGALNEILSLRTGTARPERSTLFAPTATLLDDGLGSVPSLRRWTERDEVPLHDAILSDGLPPPGSVATGLPVPLVSTAADQLLTASADEVEGVDEANRLLDQLELDSADLRTVDAALARCRVSLTADNLDAATTSLDEAEKLSTDAHDWRLRWHAGLIALARADVPAAEQAFKAVYEALPGEQAPKLALAFCAEHGRRLDRAESYYEAVWRRDRSVVSAVFGLARVLLARKDRAGAVRLLDETPPMSRHFDAARIAAVRVLSGNLDNANRPSATDLKEAANRVARLYPEGGGRGGELRTRLEAVIQEAELGVLLADERSKTNGAETALRLRLERSYRALARQSGTRAHHSGLVDLANQYRPATFR